MCIRDRDCGVACIKIEGRMKRSEYAAVVTGIYSAALKESRMPTGEEIDALKTAFSRQGFTDGYFTGKKGPDMFGIREKPDGSERKLFSAIRKNFFSGESQRVPVRFVGVAKAGQPLRLAASDDRGNIVSAEGLSLIHIFFRRPN